jgi:hypothetical protein
MYEFEKFGLTDPTVGRKGAKPVNDIEDLKLPWKMIGGIQFNKQPLAVVDAGGNEVFRLHVTCPQGNLVVGLDGDSAIYPVLIQSQDGAVVAIKVVFDHTLDYNNQPVPL